MASSAWDEIIVSDSAISNKFKQNAEESMFLTGLSAKAGKGSGRLHNVMFPSFHAKGSITFRIVIFNLFVNCEPKS